MWNYEEIFKANEQMRYSERQMLGGFDVADLVLMAWAIPLVAIAGFIILFIIMVFWPILIVGYVVFAIYLVCRYIVDVKEREKAERNKTLDESKL